MMSRWIRNAVPALLMLAAVLSANLHQSGACHAGVRCDRRLPDNTYFMLSITNMTQLKQDFAEMRIGKLLADPQMQPFLSQFSDEWEEAAAKFEEEMDFPLADLLAIPQGEITIAVIKPSRNPIAFVGMINYGTSEETVDKLLAKLDEKFVDDGAEKVTESVEGQEVNVYRSEEMENPLKAEFTYFKKDQTLVLTSGIPAAKSVLQLWDGSNTEDSLVGEENWKTISSKCEAQGEADFLVYLNPIDLLRVAIASGGEDMAPAQMMMGMLPVLGIDGLKAIGGIGELNASSYESFGKSMLLVEKPMRGLLNIFKLEEGSFAPGDWVPGNAFSYSALDWDVKAAYEAIETMVDSFQGPGATEDFLDNAQDEFMNGLHPKADIIDPLTGLFHVVQTAGDDEDITPGMFVSVGFESEESAGKILEMLADEEMLIEAEVQPSESATLYQINPEMMSGLGGPSGETVVYVVYFDKAFKIGNTGTVIENLLKGTKPEVSLKETESFQSLAGEYPQTSLSYAFSNTGMALRGYYELVRLEGIDALDPTGQMSEVVSGVDFSLLPAYQDFAKYFSPQGSFMSDDADGAIQVDFSAK